MSKIKEIGKNLKRKLEYYRKIYNHPKTPKTAKVLLWMAIGYAALPIDLIPDFIPVIGHIDDAIIIPALIYFAMRLVPDEVKKECRAE